MAFDQEPDQVLDQLEFAANDLLKTINDMKAGPERLSTMSSDPRENYEDIIHFSKNTSL